MAGIRTTVGAGFVALVLLAGPAQADPECRIQSTYSNQNRPEPIHQVEFVIAGVVNERVILSVDETPILDAVLAAEDWSTGFSGSKRCLMSGRYWLNVKIGDAEGNLWFGVSEETTIFLDVIAGAMSFNVWGPDAPGLE